MLGTCNCVRLRRRCLSWPSSHWISDNIESNISSVAVDTRGAAEELQTASEYQRKAGKRAACLMMIVVIVVCIVLLAVSFITSTPDNYVTGLTVWHYYTDSVLMRLPVSCTDPPLRLSLYGLEWTHS